MDDKTEGLEKIQEQYIAIIEEYNNKINHVTEESEKALSGYQKKSFYLLAGMSTIVFLALFGLTLFLWHYMPADTLTTLKAGSLPKTSAQVGFSKLSLTVIGGLFTFLLAFLGFRRLGQFDEEIHRLRNYMNNQLMNERQLYTDRLQTLTQLLEKRLEENAKIIKEVAKDSIASVANEVQEELKKKKDDFEQTFIEYKNALQPYEWLKNEDTKISIDEILTIADAHMYIVKLYAEDKKSSISKLIKYLVDNQHNITGDSDDYHNLTAVLGQNSNYMDAIEILQIGLEHFPDSNDLLADIIFYATKAGKYAIAEKAYKSLKNKPLQKWNWRAMTFSGDYLVAKEDYDNAIKLYTEYREIYPYEERTYAQEAEIYAKVNDWEQVIELLKEPLRKKKLRLAQVISHLSKAYFETGAYQECIDVIHRGLIGTIDEQPSSNPAILIWTRAKAKEALALQATDLSEIEKYSKEALEDYELALPNLGNRHFPEHYELRKKILLSNLRLHGIDTSSHSQKTPNDIERIIETKVREVLSEIISSNQES